MCHWYPFGVAHSVVCPVQWSLKGPSVTIENLVKRAHCFNLPASIMGAAFGVRQLCGRRRYGGKPGEPRVRGGIKRLSTSLTLRPLGKAGDTVVALPPAVRRCPEVAAAARAGLIKLSKVDPAETTKLVAAAREVAEAKGKASKEEVARLKRKAAYKAAQLAELRAKPAKKPARRRPAPAKEENRG